MRLIDADVLEPHEQLEPMGNGNYEYVEVVYKDDIDDAPTINAVPVVRCKDCIHKENWDAHIDRWWCKVHRGYFADDYFCADGREDGEE